MNTLKINEVDKKKLLKILEDARNSVHCEIGIAGSISQRLLSPTLATLLQGTRLHDVDIILLGTTDQSPELPQLRTLFRVMEMSYSEGRWYYGLSHKETGMWVDFFTPLYEQHFAPVIIEGKEYKATTLESQILYLTTDILSRSERKVPVRKKWIEKLALLMQLPETDHVLVKTEFDSHQNVFRSLLPSTKIPFNVEDFIGMALSVKSTSWLKEKIFLFRWFFTRKIRV